MNDMAMKNFRVIKNKARIGKRWLLVSGRWEQSRGFIRAGRRWVTDFVISEHPNREDANRNLIERKHT